MDIQKVIPTKSPNDLRSYEAIKLKNDLKVLLIHDETAEKSACAISVGVGSLEDKDRSLGLAHFLEHMLFMGSKKFPIHNQYSEFIALNSGHDNAWTSDEQTNYMFQISNKAFKGAVERITDFFVAPLLTPSCIQKQTQAVHEEYKLRCCEDNSRKWQILRHFAEGPYHRFSIGCIQTLSHPDVRQDLVNFFNEFYSSNRINAVLLSNLPIQTMKSELLPFFEEIPNKHLKEIIYQLPYKNEKIGKFVKMQSIKDEALMQFFWILQNLRPHYKNHPKEYLSHILGHEGQNSLLSILKQKDFASQITSYTHELMNQTMLGLQIHLTDQGVKNYEKVYNIVIDYASWMKPEQYIYQEIKETSEISFRFKEKTDNFHYVADLASTMHRIPLSQVLNHKNLYADFDQAFYQHLLKQLNPFNLLIVYSNNEQLQNPIHQKYLGGDFVFSDMPARKNSKIAFKQLPKNDFFPVDTTILPRQPQFSKAPKKIENIYFLQDSEFKVCKGGVKIEIHGKQDWAFRQFYASYFEHLIKQTIYPAQVLKLQVEIESTDSLQIKLFGFSDTVLKLIKKIGQKLYQLHNTKQSKILFDLSLDHLIEEYQNFYCQQADEIVSTLHQNLLRKDNISIEETIKILQSYKYEEIKKRIFEFWKTSSIQWIFVGNFQQKQSVDLAHEFQRHTKCDHSSKFKETQILKVQSNLKYLSKLESQELSNSACIVYFQAGPYTQQLYYTLTIFKEYIKEPFFDSLRTQKQLAYYLAAYNENSRGILGLSFILISSTKDPQGIAQEIKEFVKTFIKKMETELTEEKMATLRQSLRTKVTCPHNNLKEYFEFICDQIDKKTFYFNRKDKSEIDTYLSKITKEDILNLANKITQASLDVLVLAKPHQLEFAKVQPSISILPFQTIKNGPYHQLRQ